MMHETSSRGGDPVDEDSDDSSNQHAEQDIGNQLFHHRDVRDGTHGYLPLVRPRSATMHGRLYQ